MTDQISDSFEPDRQPAVGHDRGEVGLLVLVNDPFRIADEFVL